MNSLIISYHLLKAQLINTISNIKATFKTKPKLDQKPCYTSEVAVANYHILNLLKEIKIIDFTQKNITTETDILKIFEKFPSIKTIFISTFIQNTILNVYEKYPKHLIYIEDFKSEELVIKVHLLDVNVFKEIFVVNEQTQKEIFDEILNDPDFISFKVVTSSENQGFTLLEQRFNDSIYYDKIVTLNSSFRSILDIINNDQEVTLYYLDETFINKIKNELPNINDQIIDVLFSGQSIDNNIIINKIL